jgi:hypothetical protein
MSDILAIFYLLAGGLTAGHVIVNNLHLITSHRKHGLEALIALGMFAFMFWFIALGIIVAGKSAKLNKDE